MNTEQIEEELDPICCGDYMNFVLVDRSGVAHFYCPVCYNKEYVLVME